MNVKRAPDRAAASFEDAYQMLRAGLSAALSDIKQPRVMVTSPTDGEGKTVTCINLAICFAKAGHRVVVVDSDLRHPDAHRLLGARNEAGLTDLLLGRRPPERCLQFLELPGGGGIYFVGTGPIADNPAELLSRDATLKVLDVIGEQADIMLVDTPPVLTVADSLIIGRQVSGALMVVQAHRSTVPEVRRAKEVLERNQTRVFGVVLNRFDRRDHGYWEAPTTEADGAQTPA